MERAETAFYLGSNKSGEAADNLETYYKNTDKALETQTYWPENQFEDLEHFRTLGHFQYYLKTEREVAVFLGILNSKKRLILCEILPRV